MIGGVINLVSYGYGSTAGNLFAWMEQMGVFSHVLPFLLIFSIILGILFRTDIFEDNKMVNIIIALSVGLISLQFNSVNLFFAEIFSNLAMGLIVLVVIIIGTGLVWKKGSESKGLFAFIAGIIVLIVLYSTFSSMGSYTFGYSWIDQFFYTLRYNWQGLVFVLIVLGIMYAIVSSFGKKDEKKVVVHQ